MKTSFILSSTLTVALSTLAFGAAPTITFGPSANYQKPPVETGKPNGDDLAITPEDLSKGVPAEGIDLFFGPGLQDKLSKTVNDLCAHGFTEDCTNALSHDLDVRQAIEPRNPGLAVAGIIGTLAYFVAIWTQLQSPSNQPKKISPHIHLEPSDVSLLQAQTATSVVFETAKGAPVVVVTPTPTPQAAPATATVLSSDKDGHHKGDVIVSLPTQPASLLKQLIGQTGHCKARQRRRRGNAPNLVDITNVAIFVLPNAAPHQLLNGFGIHDLPQQILHYRDEATQKALESVQAAAVKLPEFAGVVGEVTKSIASYVFAATYSVCVDHVSTLEQIAIESSLVSEDPSGDDDNDQKCPKDIKNSPACDDPACAGLENLCQKDNLKGCPCLESIKAYSQPGTKRDWDEAQDYLKAIVAGRDSEAGKPQCDADKRITLETTAFNALATKFCKDSAIGPDTSKDVSPADAGVKGYDGYKFSFKWQKSDGTCSESCVDMFSSFTKSTVCSYDSHTMAASGSQKFSCGTASFSFSDGKSTPSQAPSTASQTPGSGCQSPNHDAPRSSFRLEQSDKAVWMWSNYNCLLEFSPNGLEGCTLYFNPCSKRYKERAVSVALTVTLLSNEGGGPATPTYEDSRDTFHSIVSDCDTTTVDAKWGGWKTVERGNTMWLYNVTADQTGSYAPVSPKHKAVEVTSGPYCKKSWISG